MQKKISVVMIGVRDMDRAVRFYRHTLGLPLKFATPTYTEFNTAGAVLALEKRKRVFSLGPSFTFVTTNINLDERRMRQRKVIFWRKLRQESFGKLMMLKDTEGNIFEVVEYKKK